MVRVLRVPRSPVTDEHARAAASARRGDDVEALDQRLLRKQVPGTLEQRSGDWPGEMGLAALLVGERVEDAERRGAETKRKPAEGPGFCSTRARASRRNSASSSSLPGFASRRTTSRRGDHYAAVKVSGLVKETGREGVCTSRTSPFPGVP